MRPGTRIALWCGIIAIPLSLAPLASIFIRSAAPGTGSLWRIPVELTHLAPVLVTIGALAFARERGLLPGTHTFLTGLVSVIALVLNAAAQVSWSAGFEAADTGNPAPPLARLFLPLLLASCVVGAVAIAIVLDGLIGKRLHPAVRTAIGIGAGLVTAPVVGVTFAMTPLAGAGASVVLVALITFYGPRRSPRPAAWPAPSPAPAAVWYLIAVRTNHRQTRKQHVSTTTLRHIVTLSATAALALGLSACGHNDTNGSAATGAPTGGAAQTSTGGTRPGAPAPGASAIPTIPDNPNADVSTGGSYTASVDGSPYVIDDAVVACVKAEALTTLTVASPSNVGGKGIVVVLDDSGGVSGLTIGIEGGQRIGYIEGSPVGSAEATIDGSTYTITGSAPYVDTSTPAASGLKSYDITITCS